MMELPPVQEILILVPTVVPTEAGTASGPSVTVTGVVPTFTVTGSNASPTSSPVPLKSIHAVMLSAKVPTGSLAVTVSVQEPPGTSPSIRTIPSSPVSSSQAAVPVEPGNPTGAFASGDEVAPSRSLLMNVLLHG